MSGSELADRKHWLAFACCTVDHARLVRDGLRRRGVTAELVYGAMPYALIMILFTMLLIFFPTIVTWLPNSMLGI